MGKNVNAIELTRNIENEYELILDKVSDYEKIEEGVSTHAIDNDVTVKEQCEKVEKDLTNLRKKLEKSFSEISDEDMSKQFHGILNNYISSAKLCLNNVKLLNEKLSTQSIIDTEEIQINNEMLRDFINNLRRIVLMANMATINSNIIIVGKNGSGKSTFVNSLNSIALDNITVIPAQKVLYFDLSLLRQKYDLENYRQINLKPINNDFKEENMYIGDIASPFTAMISALVNDDIAVGQEDRQRAEKYPRRIERTESKLDKVKKVWNDIIPEITLNISKTQDSCLMAEKITPSGNSEYSINSLSDGEKCILFYVGNIILAKRDSYIVVDEPETFLNPASYNRLWDILIEERSDCQFIFTSHNPDFITARENTTLVWCKHFALENSAPTDNTELEILHDKDKLSSELPTELISELVGSRKRILFCEGTNEKYDYKIYSKLYEEYTVKPVGGHDKVIQYTKTFNELPQWIENSAIGIIDNDGMSNSEKENLEKDKVFCLPYNEIEMLLLDEEVIFQVLKDVKYPEDIQTINKKIKEFKSKFVSTIEVRKNKIIYDIVKNRVDYKIRTEFIDSKRYKTVEDIKKYLDEFSKQMGIDNISEEVNTEVAEAIKNKEYSDLLRICTLKDEVTKGITDKIFGRDYVKCALARINQNDKIKEYLRNQISLPK